MDTKSWPRNIIPTALETRTRRFNSNPLWRRTRFLVTLCFVKNMIEISDTPVLLPSSRNRVPLSYISLPLPPLWPLRKCLQREILESSMTKAWNVFSPNPLALLDTGNHHNARFPPPLDLNQA